MKCEWCHQADAATAVRKQGVNEEQELYVCQACARELSRRAPAASGAPAPPAPEAEPAPPLMGMILDAAFEIVGRAMNLSDPVCSTCGITRGEYRKNSRLGCPACYEAFSRELDAAVFDLHRSLQHVGKAPERSRQACRLRQLENDLREAIREQRYEDAVALRDEVRRLSGASGDVGENGGC